MKLCFEIAVSDLNAGATLVCTLNELRPYMSRLEPAVVCECNTKRAKLVVTFNLDTVQIITAIGQTKCVAT